MDKNEGVLSEIQPELIEDYRTLKGHIHEQKDENEALYKQLLSLKKETASSAQKIALYRSKIEMLEKTLGVTKFNEEMEHAKHYKGSIYQTQTAGFSMDDEDDHHQNILNTS